MKFLLFEAAKYDEQWWVGLLGIEYGDFDGHLLYIECDLGHWKLDLLWLRPLWARYVWCR